MMKFTQQSPAELTDDVNGGQVKNRLEERWGWREGTMKGQGETESHLGQGNYSWSELGGFKRSRHGYTYYQSDL